MPSTLIGVSLALFGVNAMLEGAITVSVLRAIDKAEPGLTPERRLRHRCTGRL